MSLTTTLSSAVLASIMALSPVAQEVMSDNTQLGSSSPSPTSTAEQSATANPIEDEDTDSKTVQSGSTAFSTAKAPLKKTSTIKLDKDEVNILGVEWEGEGNPQPEYRYKQKNGEWSAWEEISVDDGGADPGTPDALNEVENMSEIIPIFDSEEAQVRFGDEKASGVKNTEIKTVSTEVTSADKEISSGGNADVMNLSALTGNASAPVANPSSLPTEVNTAAYNPQMGANIVTRKEWGANEKQVKCKSGVASKAQGVIVHHTAGSNSYTKAQAPGIIRGYLTYHTQSRGWCDLGYNFLVDKFGTIYEGRAGSIDKAMVGAHASGFNTGTVGVSVMGTYTGSAPPAAAQNSVARVIAYNANKYGFNPTGKMTMTSGGGGTSKHAKGKKVNMNVVSGHRDTSYTECPGISFYNRLGAIRTNAKKIQSDLNKPSTPKPPQYVIKGAIKTYYDKNGGEKKFGKAKQNERKLSNPAGWVQTFEKGHIYYSSKTGARFITNGNFYNKWKSQRWEKGRLGFPTSDQRAMGNAKHAQYQNFQGGTIISYSKGTYILWGGIGNKWKKLDWERSYLKLPISDEKCGLKDKGCFQKFEGGSIHWSSKSGSHDTKKNSAIQNKWKALKYENGKLGYPTGSEKATSKNVVKQTFQGGTVAYNKSTKKTSVSYKK